MPKFLTGNELNSELEKIFETADKQIILISPFINLHDRYASALTTKKDNHKLQITIVFGKNEGDMSRSIRQDDFNFFKEFPNIQIGYEKRLHAKYYANESAAILTSMNLYGYSQNNNIEAGILARANLLSNLEDSVYSQASNYFDRVILQSELLFQKTPHYENAMLGLTKKYVGSNIKVDKLSDFFSTRAKYDSTAHHNEVLADKKFETMAQTGPGHYGYCIRTRKIIPFNPRRPYSDEAYKNWARVGNDAYPEKYCHFSGEQSKGETTKAKPILQKNWNNAKKTFNL